MRKEIYRLYLDDRNYTPNITFATFEEAEAFRIELASTRAGGAGEQGFSEEYDAIYIERLVLHEENPGSS